MTKINLRSYNREIESALENGEFEEAIFNCRHILHFFPKHVATYQILAKAYLENAQFLEAKDIFQRVLSAIPDEFVANVGISVILEYEGDINEALWYMLRAFDIKPANTLVQNEIRRLYQKRDGIYPAKIQLTRTALARLYLKGGHFPQAVAELDILQNEDPENIIIQILKARVLNKSGKTEETKVVCLKILSQLPFSYVANQLLVDNAVKADQSYQDLEYFQRLKSLDPYIGYDSTNPAFSTKVPDQTVVLEKLSLHPENDESNPSNGEPFELEDNDWRYESS